jgi:hypothetical protein
MLAGEIALAVAALFTGAALYVNIVEQPARLLLDDRALLAEWKPAYEKGTLMQAPLAVIGFLLGLVAWMATGRFGFLFGSLLMIANWPWTLIRIMPLNAALKRSEPSAAGPQTRAMIERWNRLHAVRTGLGASATIAFLVTLACVPVSGSATT